MSKAALARLAAVLSLAFWLLPATTIQVAAGGPTPFATVTLGQHVYQASPGIELARSVRDPATGNCLAVPYVIRLGGPVSIGYGSVAVGMDEQCVLRVRDVVFTAETRSPDGSKGPMRPAAHRLLWGAVADASTTQSMWGKHAMHEQFGIITTYAYEQFQYTIDGSNVSNPVGTSEYCWQDGVGWTILDCYAGLEQSGPTAVQRWTKGDFTNQGGTLQHHLGTHPEGLWNGWTTYCDDVGATMPPGWYTTCESSWI